MRIQKYLTSTLFTGLFVTATVFSPAMGQEQSLQPQGSWAITKVDRTDKGGNSYCTLSRKYDEGIVLSLGRNQTEEYSLAIDFQKPTFEKGKPLKINLQPGPGQIRAYDMMPTSEKAIVIRLGWDTGFFDALNQSQQMKVKIGENGYAFSMPEITKGQGDLKECMEGLQAAAKGGKQSSPTKDVLNAEAGQASGDFDAAKAGEKSAPVTAAKADVDAAEKGLLESFANSIRSQEPSLKQDETAPRKNFAKSGREENAGEGRASASLSSSEPATAKKTPAPMPPVEAPSKENKDIAAKSAGSILAEASNQKREKAEQASSQQSGFTPLPGDMVDEAEALKVAKTAPSASGAKAASDSDTDDLRARMATLVSENAALKASLQQKESAKSTAPSADIEKQMKALEAEKQALQERLRLAEEKSDKKADPSEVQKLQASLKELEIKNAQLEDSLRQSQTRIAETAINTESKSLKKIVELQTKLDAAQKDNAALAKQLESLKLRQEDTAVAAVAGDWDLEQATKRFNEAEREIRRLGLQLEQERTSCNREKAQIEQMLFDPAVADQKQIQRLSQLQTELETAQKKIADQQKIVQEQVNQQLAVRTQSIEAEKNALGQQVATLQKSLADKDAAYGAERTTMQGQLAALQKSVADSANVTAEKTTLAQQVATLQKSLADKDQAMAAEKAALQAQLDSLKTTLTQKDQQLAAANAQPKVNPAEVDQRIAQEIGKARAAADAEISSLKAQNAALSQGMESLKTTLAVKDKALSDAQVAAQTPKVDPVITKQLADLQASMQQLKKDNDLLRDQNIVLRQESDKLQLQLSDAQNNGATRADKVASMQLELEDLKRQMGMKDRQNVTYQNQIAALQQETTQLKNRLVASDTASSSSNAEVGELTRQIQTLQRQIGDLQRRERAHDAADRAASATVYNGITPAAGSVQPAIPVMPVQAQPIPVNNPYRGGAPSAGMDGFDKSSIQSLLQKSGLNVRGQVEKASSGFAGADNFAWTDTSNVRGLASVKPLGGKAFDSMVSDYIAYQKGQCSGDFASMPSPTNGSAAKPMSLYEVACVSSNQSLSYSLLFFEDQGRFIAISNEIAAADMDVAMDSRDRIAGFVRGL